MRYESGTWPERAILSPFSQRSKVRKMGGSSFVSEQDAKRREWATAAMVHQAVLDQTERWLFIVLPFPDEPLSRLQLTFQGFRTGAARSPVSSAVLDDCTSVYHHPLAYRRLLRSGRRPRSRKPIC
jgi:hypothetical protein